MIPGPAVGRSVTVKVPATAANLGPGFDTLGIALAQYDELQVTIAEQPGLRIEVHGVGEGEVALDESNIIVGAIRHVFERHGVAQPGLKLVAHNTIPHGRGLGSSGAAIVSGIVAAATLLNEMLEVPIDGAEMLALATELEGHPDNVAPALFGSATIAWMTPAGPQHKKLLVHRGVSPLVFVPESTMSTRLARSLQPTDVPHADAVFNVSRSALLVVALMQSPELLLAATEDRLHQDYRSSAMPATRALIDHLRAAGFPAVVSGAGPSVLVLASDPGQRLAAAELAASIGATDWTPLMLAVDFKGATVIPHPDER